MPTAMKRAACPSLKAAINISHRLWWGLRMEILNGESMLSSALPGLNGTSAPLDTLNDTGRFSQLGAVDGASQGGWGRRFGRFDKPIEFSAGRTQLRGTHFFRRSLPACFLASVLSLKFLSSTEMSS